MEPAKILVVDDEAAILRLLKEALTQWGYQVTGASSAAEALQALRGDMFDAVITDIRMPDMNGLELLKEIKRHDESVEVVVMTGYPTIASAVEALKEGAFDYLSKPLLLDELRHLMTRMTERRFLRGEVHSLRARLGEELTVNELVGNSAPMQRVKEIISKVAPTDSPVLIEGESGTGKELVAAAIHRLSPRAKGPFIPVNCSAIPEDLLESEFFGHVRGAFSGAVSDTLGLFRGANEGTIFLDEVAELSPGLQVKLLRVLQEMQVRPVGSTKAYAVDVRVIAATNRDLERTIAEGQLRQDLYYRLNERRHSPARRGREGADLEGPGVLQGRQGGRGDGARHLAPDDLSSPEGVRNALKSQGLSHSLDEVTPIGHPPPSSFLMFRWFTVGIRPAFSGQRA